MRVISFPNGQVLTSSAMSAADVQVCFQIAIAQMLGLNAGFVLSGTTVAQSNALTVPSTTKISAGQTIIGVGIPPGTKVQSVNQQMVTMTNPAAASQTTPVAIGADPKVFSAVRVGYVTEGQPGFARDADTAIVIAMPVDDGYNKQRNETRARNDQQSTLLTTTYTRAWQLAFTFYGPSSGDNARLVKSCLYLDWVHDLLAQSNLYLVLSPPDPIRAPELIEDQWWERNDLTVRYYEGITESITVPMVAGLEIQITTDTGQTATITAAQPE